MSADDLLTVDELAGRLKIKPATIQRWQRQGRIPVRKLTHKVIRYSLAEVVSALEAGPTAPASKGGAA